MFREREMQIIKAEVPPQQEVGRGRTFVRIYAALVILVTAAFVAES